MRCESTNCGKPREPRLIRCGSVGGPCRPCEPKGGSAGLFFDASLELYLAARNLNDVLHFLRAFLLLEVIGLFAYKLLEVFARELIHFLARGLFRGNQRLIQLVDFFILAIWLGASNAERSIRCCFFLRRLGAMALGFDGSRSRAEMMLHVAFFTLLETLAENLLVLGVRLRKIVEAKSVSELQVAHPLGIALHHLVDTPLDFGRRTFPSPAKILVIFHLELADVPFELGHVFVDGRRHGSFHLPC